MGWKATFCLTVAIYILLSCLPQSEAACHRQFGYRKISRYIHHYENTARQYPYGSSRVVNLHCTALVPAYYCGGYCNRRFSFNRLTRRREEQCCLATRTLTINTRIKFKCTYPGYYYRVNVVYKTVRHARPYPLRCRCRRSRSCGR